MAKVTPVNWEAWIQEALVQKQNILSMGFVDIQNDATIAKGGHYYVRPYQENLAEITTVANYTASTDITAYTASDYQENLVQVHKGAGYYETQYDVMTRGGAGLNSLMLQRSEVVLNAVQDSLVSTVQGVFGTALSAHVYDATAIGTGEFSFDVAVDACESIFDEQAESFDAFIMHSKQLAALKKAGMINFANSSDFANVVVRTGKVPVFNGLRVVTNNTLCVNEGTVANPIYPIYVVKGQPLYLGWNKGVRVLEKEDAAHGGGTNYVYWYADFVPAVKGVSWTHTSWNPTDANLATAGYWTKVYETKHIPIIKIKSNYIIPS